MASAAPPASGAGAAVSAADSAFLSLIGVVPSAESLDYVHHKKQFQLHTLLTEQRHPRTMNLSETLREDQRVGDGLRELFSVDDDIAAKFAAIAEGMTDDDRDTLQAMRAMVDAVGRTIAGGRRVYVYGCGATGRLAKQMESAFWKPFWARVKAHHPDIYAKAEKAFPYARDAVGLDGKSSAATTASGAGAGAGAGASAVSLGDRVIGEMTGGDRALISSLEGFEDSSVIGTILAALDQWKASPPTATTTPATTTDAKGLDPRVLTPGAASGAYDAAVTRAHLFFVFNNPNDRLMPFERSKRVINEPGAYSYAAMCSVHSALCVGDWSADSRSTGCCFCCCIAVLLLRWLTR
jgi:N-acetylmuramic acid 6-phosphate etherase